jgi:hypothetical protein
MFGDMENIKVVVAYFKAVTDVYPGRLRKTEKPVKIANTGK